ncbi:hypothetical protein [Paraferrimonas sedimenticola]|uniref:Uncharacterized protein n=1 Tax=Paraferrimonas sedimenticola TaxID=375674 RepID=A0AA37VWN9_9GAMM|nr:hypothetical protein [Paraferrimonas sedimenticola]GLP94945.1 hypothetical protein GCM10007895_02510 [Paraferrimonas sedimenticola]GLP97622.1 hypothetical protein GCM10007895_29290 [Paraferrimonas sedimenticola]
MPKLNELFFEKDEAYMYVSDIAAANDLDDYICGFHRISISIEDETLDGQKVLKVCFGDLIDPEKLKSALDDYFE